MIRLGPERKPAAAPDGQNYLRVIPNIRSCPHCSPPAPDSNQGREAKL
jgi:hypothetical protein